MFTAETRKSIMIMYPLISTELTRGQGCVGGGGSCKADSECCSKRCQRISFNNYHCEFGNGCVNGGGSCIGGALGGALAIKDNWIWSIPAGAVGGALVGCQVDGG